MSVVAADQVHCGTCNALNSAAHAFCGVCRAELGVALRTAAPAAARRRFRDGPRLVVVSGGVFVVSAFAALATYIVLEIGNGLSLISSSNPPPFVYAIFIAAFAAAGSSLVVFAIASLRLGWGVARTIDYAEHRETAAGVAAVGRRATGEVVVTTRRSAEKLRARGRSELAEARPKVAEVAKHTRRRYEAEVAPHVAAGAEKAADAAVKGAAEARKAAAKGVAWAGKQRDRRRGGY
jgi:hypothetical protein